MSLFAANDIAVSFGGIKAVHDLSFAVEAGEVFSIVGPNGAGKTTIFNLISRIYDVDHGALAFDGRDITNVPTFAVAEMGIARTFQNTELFDQESVLKNLLIGCHVHRRSNLLQDLLFLPSVKAQELEFRARAEEVIDLLDLQRYRDQVIGNLPYGVRKMVEIARALCLEPKLLLLDEPTANLDPRSTGWLVDFLQDLDLTVLVTTHNLSLAGELGRRCLVLAENHRMIYDGDLASILEDLDLLVRANLVHTHRHRHDGLEHRHPHVHDWD